MPEARDAIIDVTDLAKRFGGVQALRGVSMSIDPGEILGMLGPNGSGKTTLVNCISGVLEPTAGRVMLDGHDITRWSRIRRARHGLIRTYQNLRLFSDMTAAENIEAGLVAIKRASARSRREHVAQALESQRLTSVARTPVRALAYGQQRRVEVARALVGRPRVLVLDEPAAGLGEGETSVLREAVLRARDEFGCAVLLIDHAVNFVLDLSDRVVVLHEGSVLCQGPPAEIQRNPEVATVYLGGAEVSSA
jgi:branched-chain amino acid transport system ATP-binding protein